MMYVIKIYSEDASDNKANILFLIVYKKTRA